jgi:hypothetical protein
VPIVIILLFLFMTGPQILDSVHPRTHVDSLNLPNDVQLKITLEPTVNDFDQNYFPMVCTVEMGVEENSTREPDFNILVIPGPVPSNSSLGVLGVSVPFGGLVDAGNYYVLTNSNWSTFEGYSYTVNLLSAYSIRASGRFPGDFYSSSTIYVWFSAPFYPSIELSPASSLPRGFVAFLTNPEFVKPEEFYNNRIDRISHLFIGMPSNDVLTFQIVVQRDSSSIFLYSFYTVIILYAACEVLVLSYYKIESLEGRLEVFVGLAIASVAFLWSIRQGTNVISWSEIVLIIALGTWISFEVKKAWGTKEFWETRES